MTPDPWRNVGRSIEKDVTRTVALIAGALVALGAVITHTIDIAVHRHRVNRARQ